MIYIIHNIKRIIFEYILLFLYYSHMAWLYICIMFYSNYETSVIYIKNNKIIENTEQDSDFFIKIYNNENKKTVIKVSDDYCILNSPEIKTCNYNFILVLLKVSPLADEHSNNYYEIDITNILKNNNITYYAEDAIIFDYNFYNWLILKHLNNKLDVTDIQGVDFIDQFAEQVSITYKQYIKLKLDEYLICEYKE